MGDASCSAGTIEGQDSSLSSAATRAFIECKGYCGHMNGSGAQELLAVVSGGQPLERLMEQYKQRGPCTNVWTKDKVAYRCCTCQTTRASAICVQCFKDGGHEAHDFLMYIAEAGGCCDCGDLTNWKESGCCPAHKPSGPTPTTTVPLPLHRALEIIVYNAFFQLLPWMSAAGNPGVALEMVQLLCKLCAAPAFRAIACSVAVSPFSRFFQIHEELEQVVEWPGVETGMWQRARDGLRLQLIANFGMEFSALDVLSIHIFGSPHENFVSELTTLLLLLLYDADFKTQYTLSLLKQYPKINRDLLVATSRGGIPPLGRALDRITVQLFNTADATMELVEKHNLLGMLLGQLQYTLTVVRRQFEADRHSSKDLKALVDCGAMRVLLDLSMVLNHAPVAAFLLSDEERFARLLKGLRAYQETFPWVRMTREHAAFESTMWRYASCIEDQVWRWVMDPLLQMMAGRESAEPGDSGTGAQACALPLRDRLNLLQSCTLETMKHAWEWVFENAPAYNRTHIYDELLAGASVSLALPLQHLTARLVCLLFAVQDWSGECRCSSTPAVLQGQVGAGALAAKEGEAADREGEGGLVMQQHLWFPKMSVHLFDCREHRTLERGTYKEMWEAISFGSLRNLVWMAQVQTGLWVRNGRALEQMTIWYYNSTIMAEHGFLPDLALLQIWFASSADQPDRALGELLLAFGGKQLVDAARRRLPAASHVSTPKAAPQETHPQTPGSSHLPALQEEPTASPGGDDPATVAAMGVSESGFGAASPAGMPGQAAAGCQGASPVTGGPSCEPHGMGAHPDSEALRSPVGAPDEQAQGAAPPAHAPAGGFAERPAPSKAAEQMVEGLESLMTAWPRLVDGLSSAWGNDGTRWTDDRRLSVTANGLQTLLLLLRERSLFQRDVKAVVRREVIAWLAVEDMGYSIIRDRVLHSVFSEQLLNEVLEEVADYIPYNMQSKARYRLKREAWRHFDSHFPRYGPHELQEALSRAADNEWDPAWQLEQTSMELPFPLRQLPTFMMTPLFHWLLWAALREVEFNVTKPAAHQLATSAMCLLAEGLHYLQNKPEEEDDRLPAARASMTAVLEGAPDFRGIKALLHMIVTSDVLDSSMQRLAEAAHGLVLSFLAAHGSTCDETPSRPAVEEAAASPMKLSLHLSSPDSDRREQIRRRQEQMLAEMKARQLQFEESQMEVQSEADEEAGPPEPEGQASLTRPPVARQSGMVSCGSLADMDTAQSAPVKMMRYNPGKFGRVKGTCVGCLDETSAEPLGWVTFAHVCCTPKFAGRAAPSWTQLGNADHQQQQEPCVAPYCAADVYPGTHLHCCGHLIHGSCAQTYRRQLADHTLRRHVMGVEESEFFCPSCRRLSNSVLPALLPDPTEDSGALPPTVPRGPSAAGPSTSQGQGAHPAPALTLSDSAARARAAIAALRPQVCADAHAAASTSCGPALASCLPPASAGLPVGQAVRDRVGSSEEPGPSGVERMVEGDAAPPAQAAEPCSPAAPRPRKRRAALIISNGFLQEARFGRVAPLINTFTADLRRPRDVQTRALLDLARRASSSLPDDEDDAMFEMPPLVEPLEAVGRELAAVAGALAAQGQAMDMEMVEREIQLGFGQEEEQDMSRAWEAASLGASPDTSSAPAADDFGHLEGDGDQLWATLAHQISHWEAMNRGSPLSDSCVATAMTAHWRATANLALLCQAYGCGKSVLVPGYGAALLERVLGFLLGEAEEPVGEPWLNLHRALLPTASDPHSLINQFADQAPENTLLAFICQAHQLPGLQAGLERREAEGGGAAGWGNLLGDPLALLLTLYATALNQDSGWSSRHPRPPPDAIDAFKVFLGVTFTIASTQSLMASYAVRRGGGERPGDPAAAAPAPLSLGQVYEKAVAALQQDAQLLEAVSGGLLPFLRQARLLKEAFAIDAEPAETWAVPPPDLLLPACPGGLAATANALTASLGLADVATAASAAAKWPCLDRLLLRWLASVPFLPPAAAPPPTDQLPAQLRQAVACPPSLLQLPDLYQDLFIQCASAECVECGQVPADERAVCLQCGDVLCYSTPQTRRRGQCLPLRNLHIHALLCGAGTAIFLKLKQTRLLVVRGRKHIVVASPYLDSHGEEDAYFRRGRPLRLVPVRMQRPTAIWQAGALDFNASLLHTPSFFDDDFIMLE